MKIIDNITLVPDEYGQRDVWVSRDSHRRGDGRGEWIELRMRSRFGRDTQRFAVLYVGPQGAVRRETGGPQVPGPHGGLLAQADIIDAYGTERSTCVDVEEGDVLILHGQRMVIADSRTDDYPELVTEAEWGLILAQRAIQQEIDAARQAHPDQAVADAVVNTLLRVTRQLRGARPHLRARSVDPTADPTADPTGTTAQ